MRKAKKDLTNLDLTKYTKNGTLRKRKPKTSRNYFTQETEDAIIAYNSTDNYVERNKLFNEHINTSFHKLAENIINTFKFHYTGLNSIEDLKHEVVYFFLEKIHLYDQAQGKAYSYFGTIALRYLIVYNKKQYKEIKDRKELDAVDEDLKVNQALREDDSKYELKGFLQEYVEYVERNIDEIHEVTKTVRGENVTENVIFSEKDKLVVRTVLDLIRKAEDKEIFYKPAIYLEIRQRTGQKTLDITRVIKVMKSIMKRQLKEYHLNGCLDVHDNVYL